MSEDSAVDRLKSWDSDADLQRARRLLRPTSPGSRLARVVAECDAKGKRLRFDPPSSQQLRVALPLTFDPASSVVNPPSTVFAEKITRQFPASTPAPGQTGVRFLSSLGWMLVSFGLMGMACGGVLYTWGWFTARQELCDGGLPTALIGQATILLGLLLALMFRSTTRVSSAGACIIADDDTDLHKSIAMPSFANEQERALAEVRAQLDYLSAQITAAAVAQPYR